MTDGYPAFLGRRFVEARTEAEASARESKRKDPRLQTSLRFEITLDEIYQRIGEIYSLTDSQVAELKQWEIESEIANVIPDTEMIARIAELRAEGQTVVLISDMYLPRSVIDQMLAAASPVLTGLPVYLSSEYGTQKSTGRLYVETYLNTNYDFGRWVHTGDHAEADGSTARQMGMLTEARVAPTFDGFEQALVRYLDTYDGYLLAGMMREARVSDSLTDVELFAYRNVALYLVPYVRWVLGDAIARGYEVLYFISRDGHHMKSIADAIIESESLPLRTAYVYGSRRAWRLASQIDGIDDDTFSPHGSFGGIRSFEALVETSRLSRETLIELFPEFAEYEGSDGFDGETAGRIVGALKSSAEYRRQLARIAADDRDLAARYLSQELDLSARFAFVEYWGRGYTQDCLARLLEFVQGESIETPFYYARSIYGSEGAAVRHNYTSASYSLLLIEAIFANLPYGTTEGYRDVDGRMEPLLSDREYDVDLYDAMSSMLVKFVEDGQRTPYVDARRLWQDAFRFGFEHFRSSPTSHEYRTHIAGLRDAVELGGREREFAPVFRVRDFAAYLRGTAMPEITRSLPLSLSRTRGAGGVLLNLQQKVGFRRIFKGAAAKVSASYERTVAGRRQGEIVRANPPAALGASVAGTRDNARE